MGTLLRYFQLIRHAAWPGRDGIARPNLRHYLVSTLLLLGLPVYLAYHAFGFLLDELFFRGYRRVSVREPVFVVGPPRSGTTSLHEALADDPQYTTMATWECLFGLSVSWRRFWIAFGGFDRRIGRPFGRLADALVGLFAGGLDDIHPVSLDAPEEDYFAFFPLLWCFILVVPFPDAPWLWRWARFDEALTARRRRRLMGWYRRAIQRHLHVHGEKRYLAKNAAFAPLAHSLVEAFPDAYYVCCMREPRAALSSQLSSVEPGLTFCHGDYHRRRFGNRMTARFGFYYRNLLAALGRDRCRAVFLPLPAMNRLDEAVAAIYGHFDLPLSKTYRERLAARARAARNWDSAHDHDPRDLDVDPAVLRAVLGDLGPRFDFTARHPVLVGARSEPLRRVATS